MPLNFLRWRFVDPFDATESRTYLFPLNPNAMTSPFPRRQITSRATTAINGRQVLIEGSQTPTEWTFSGDILEPNHYEALRSWVLDRTGRRVQLYDHFGRQLTIVPLQFNPTPKRVVGKYYRHTYEITALVIDITGPSFKVDPPLGPKNVQVVPGYLKATITWDPPLSARGSAVTRYVVGDIDTGQSVSVAVADARKVVLKDVTAGVHNFIVQAVSTAGTSQPTFATANIKPIVGPTGITISSLAMDYQKGVLKWNPPTDDGGADLDYYTLTATMTTGGASTPVGTWNVPAGTTTYTYTGLLAGENSYAFTVAGHNQAGFTGAAATATAKTLRPAGPSAPVILDFSVTRTTAYMKWSTPVRDGGVPILNYYVVAETRSANLGGVQRATLGPTARDYTFRGLTPGSTYTFYVYADNTGSFLSASKASSSQRTIATVK